MIMQPLLCLCVWLHPKDDAPPYSQRKGGNVSVRVVEVVINLICGDCGAFVSPCTRCGSPSEKIPTRLLSHIALFSLYFSLYATLALGTVLFCQPPRATA